jgi:hypothetical protein
MDNLLRRIRELDRRRIEYFLHAPNTLVQTFEREMREAIGKLSQVFLLNVFRFCTNFSSARKFH